jgi:hypothetical protein
METIDVKKTDWENFRREIYLAWAQSVSPKILLDEYALLSDGLRCETVPGFLSKRQIVHEELSRRLKEDKNG